jgi:hypothetical protein
MKTVVIISVHNEEKNCFSSKDFNGYKDFENEDLAHAFIKSNKFDVNETCIDDELNIRLIYLSHFQYNKNRELAKQLFIEGSSEDAQKYWDKQEEIRNNHRKEEGFIYCKKYDEMAAEDYKGSLKKALTQDTIEYISHKGVFGYLGHSARKHEHDKYIEKVIENVIMTVDGVKVNKWEALSSWLSSKDARHWMDSIEDLHMVHFKEKFDNYVSELMTLGYIYNLKEHTGSYKSTMELEDKYAARTKVTSDQR